MDAQVIVVGPVGLTLAIDLGRRGNAAPADAAALAATATGH